MSDTKTFDLRYVGKRFSQARMPVEVLSDLPAFRDLLVAFAKDEWRSRHPGRLRVPKGFERNLAFDLVGIEDGSAVPKLEWVRDDTQEQLPGIADEMGDVLEAAYDDVVKLVAGTNPIDTPLNAEKIRALNRFGAGLKDNEKIQLTDRSNPTNVVSLDAYRRKKLITGARETYQTRYEDTGILAGAIVINDYDGKIIVSTAKYGNIEIPLDRDEVVLEYDGNIDQEVQFELLVEFDQQDSLRRVAAVFDISLVGNEHSQEYMRCSLRLDELGALNAGWLDGGGSAVSPEAAKVALQFVDATREHCASYKIFPTETGGVLFDFEVDGWDYSILFKGAGSLEMYGIEIDGDQEMEAVEFASANDEFYGEFLRRVSGRD